MGNASIVHLFGQLLVHMALENDVCKDDIYILRGAMTESIESVQKNSVSLAFSIVL